MVLESYLAIQVVCSIAVGTILQGMKLDLRTQGGGHTVVHEFAIKMHFSPRQDFVIVNEFLIWTAPSCAN